MKRTFIFLFFQCLISIFLTSEVFAFTTQETTASVISTSDKNTFEIPINQQALFVEELGSAKIFELIISLNSFPFSERNNRSNELVFFGNHSKAREGFFYKNNLKKLITQQIYPFHLFW